MFKGIIYITHTHIYIFSRVYTLFCTGNYNKACAKLKYTRHRAARIIYLNQCACAVQRFIQLAKCLLVVIFLAIYYTYRERNNKILNHRINNNDSDRVVSTADKFLIFFFKTALAYILAKTESRRSRATSFFT